MSNQLQPNSQPQVGKYLWAPGVPQRPQLPQASLDLLIAGLRMAEINLDYVETHNYYKILSQSPDQKQRKLQPFNTFLPNFTAYLSGIESEARGTAREFDLIIQRIGGLPVKVMLSDKEDIADGSIVRLKDYYDGAWVYSFANQQHQDGIDLRGDTNMLQSWHSAAQDLPKEFNTK